jgi:hypothetical protein
VAGVVGDPLALPNTSAHRKKNHFHVEDDEQQRDHVNADRTESALPMVGSPHS